MQATDSAQQPKVHRLAAVRRFYVYLVAFVSQIFVLVGVIDLIDLIGRMWLQSGGILQGTFVRSATARSIGMLAVATPLFLVHWWLGQRFREDPPERASVLRKLFLYGSTAVSLGLLLANLYPIIRDLTWLIAGVPVRSVELWPSGWLTWGSTAGIGAGLLGYWHRVLVADGDQGREQRGARFVRQLFLLVAGLFGLGLAVWGARTLIQLGLQVAVDRWSGALDQEWWHLPFGGAFSQLLVGGWLWRVNWQQWRQMIDIDRHEGQAALRRIYLYLSVFSGAALALTPAALLLREALLMALGSGGGTLAELLEQMVEPTSFIPIGVLVWGGHWALLRRETDAYGDSGQSAMVRRLYAYLVAAIGLALLWTGAVQVIHALLGSWLTGDLWDDPLATGLSLLAVGAPVWTIFWRRVQSIAEAAEGAQERDSWPRKVYLYGVALVGALVLLSTLAQALYRVLLTLLGEPDLAFSSNELAYQLADSAIAAVLWSIHLWALRADGRFEKPPQVVEAPDPHAALQVRIALLEQELNNARTELAALEQRRASS
ncbi:MAG: DUF5671 domain-containing protein [Caldilinea sp.]